MEVTKFGKDMNLRASPSGKYSNVRRVVMKEDEKPCLGVFELLEVTVGSMLVILEDGIDPGGMGCDAEEIGEAISGGYGYNSCCKGKGESNFEIRLVWSERKLRRSHTSYICEKWLKKHFPMIWAEFFREEVKVGLSHKEIAAHYAPQVRVSYVEVEREVESARLKDSAASLNALFEDEDPNPESVICVKKFLEPVLEAMLPDEGLQKVVNDVGEIVAMEWYKSSAKRVDGRIAETFEQWKNRRKQESEVFSLRTQQAQVEMERHEWACLNMERMKKVLDPMMED